MNLQIYIHITFASSHYLNLLKFYIKKKQIIKNNNNLFIYKYSLAFL